ncbi:MAG: hypothetical protein SFU56_05035 [Capsulimonadales bacterium]|nr:hypothetical protein [Capsulimonadales bacterium]
MQSSLKPDRRKVVVFSLTTFFIASLLVGWWIRKVTFPIYFNGKLIPWYGLKVNPAGDVLGNPEEAVKDFRQIYAVMERYRREHGKLPGAGELMKELPRDAFHTPDFGRSDIHAAFSDTTAEYIWQYPAERPNGQAYPATPKPGERDVWMICDTYARMNQTVFRDRHSEYSPKGCYVVLWSDGTVEKIPVRDVIYYQTGRNEWTLGFRGETGLPTKVTSLTEHLGDKRNFNRVLPGS